MGEIQTQHMGFEGLLLSLLFFLVVSYGMFVYPQRKRVNLHLKFIKSIQVGDVVQLHGGIIGKIVQISSETARLQLDDKAHTMISTRHIIKRIDPSIYQEAHHEFDL
ncbi:MAG TPA: preprotein translocase subunit YajC [Gammaproteobacteria bacterium]|nr:preprotein translocase subunit YajC [Gammaproteobacteria bacterium]